MGRSLGRHCAIVGLSPPSMVGKERGWRLRGREKARFRARNDGFAWEKRANRPPLRCGSGDRESSIGSDLGLCRACSPQGRAWPCDSMQSRHFLHEIVRNRARALGGGGRRSRRRGRRGWAARSAEGSRLGLPARPRRAAGPGSRRAGPRCQRASRRALVAASVAASSAGSSPRAAASCARASSSCACQAAASSASPGREGASVSSSRRSAGRSRA